MSNTVEAEKYAIYMLQEGKPVDSMAYSLLALNGHLRKLATDIESMKDVTGVLRKKSFT